MDTGDVLDVAVTAYWRHDPADVSVNAICQMAGISKPSLYRAFGSEDGLTLAALERYTGMVLNDIFEILGGGKDLKRTLDALIEYASMSPMTETGCLFFKMRAGKHRLGPQTRAKIDEIEAVAVQAFETFLLGRRDAQDWQDDQPADMTARYLFEQIGLALTQRASGENAQQIKASLTLALSVIRPS